MNAAEVKPSTNGVIKIARKGVVKFEFEDDVPLSIDIIAIWDQWYEINWALRDKEGGLSPDKFNEHGQNMQSFVQAVVNDAYAASHADKPIPTISRGEAEAFVGLLLAEVKKFRDFFSPKKEEPSSSPESSAETRINFSQ